MRDPEASEPFTEEEIGAILVACDTDESPWIGPSARVLAYTGCHIMVLSGGWRREKQPDGSTKQWYQPPLKSDSVRGGYIYWRRPKNDKPIGIELSRHLAGWLPDWLDQPRPTSPRRYRQVLERVGNSIHIQVNPLRFRHYCAVRMKRAGLSTAAICRRLGVTATTLSIYVDDPRWVSSQKLDQSGW